MTSPRHYQTLGVADDASAEEISAAYRARLRSFRDAMREGRAPPADALDALAQAWRALGDPGERAAYDAQCRSAAAPAPPADHATGPAQHAASADGAPGEPSRHAFGFTGSGGEYFRIWIVNLLLSIVTLGIYSAWAKVRREQYFHRHLLLAEGRFDYHGQPVAILKGRLIAVGLVVLLSVADSLGTEFYVGALLLLAPLVPWVIARALRFRAANTSYRGLRFSHRGTYGQAFSAYVLGGILTLLSFGALFPRWVQQQKRFALDNLAFGQTRFRFDAGVWGFYRIFLVAGLVTVALSIAAGAAMAFLIGDIRDEMEAVGAILLLGFLFFYLPLLLFAWPYVLVRVTNLVWNSTRLGAHRFESRMGFASFLWLHVGNWLLILFTLGLYWPWARVRVARYRAAHTTLLAAGSLDAFLADRRQELAAAGEEVTEMFDFDFGL